MSKPNVKAVPNVKTLDTRNKYEKALEQMNEMLPHVIKEWDVKATFLKKKYDRLVEEGFTTEQALEIVKTRPIFE